MKVPAWFLVALSLSACVRGAVEKDTIPVYEHTGDVMGVPVLEKRPQLITVSGQVTLANPLDAFPGDLMLLLTQGEKIAAGARMARDGSFVFTGILKTGTYNLRTMGDRYYGETSVKVDSSEVNHVLLVLTKVKK